MKLIDLLIQELPKRGGWPDGVTHIGQDYDGELMFYGRGNVMTEILLDELAIDRRKRGETGAKITRDQYESALAASQKPAWKGEGLPPSGIECEARLRCNDGEWFFFRCVGVDCGVAFGWAGKDAVTLGKGSYEFRPLRTEAERKRDDAVEQMMKFATIHTTKGLGLDLALRSCYDAISAGKIPGVKLED
jgi:hypothetical protein